MNLGARSKKTPAEKKPLNLFIDTNIFLDLYHYSKDDLDQLKNLHLLIETDKVKLFLPEQVVNEFKRNRENKIKDSLKSLEEFKTYPQIPKMCEEYPESKEIRRFGKNVDKLKKTIVKKVMDGLQRKKLKADGVIGEIFSQEIIRIDSDLLSEAKKRMELGNPPGKNGSYGDAINWECLLKKVTNGQDLNLISADKDYCSPIDENEFSLFLKDEWKEKKSSQIIYYRDLSSFFKANFPEIKITDEDIKEAKIKRFARSSDFSEVRETLRDLRKIGDFSDKQVREIIKASMENGQIIRCQTYSPKAVGNILAEIVAGHEENIDTLEYTRFCAQFNIPNKKILNAGSINKILDDILNDL